MAKAPQTSVTTPTHNPEITPAHNSPTVHYNPQTGEVEDVMDGEAWRKANAAVLADLERVEIRTDGVTEVTRNKITVSVLGKGAAVTAMPEGSYHILGMISGTATGINDEVLNDGTPSWSLSGEFIAVTADGKKVFKSGRLFLPNGIHHMMLSAVREGKRPDFAIEVRSIHANNPAGYTYEFVNLIQPVMDRREVLFRKLMQQRADELNRQKAAALAAASGQQALLTVS